jgi:pyruvate formate lyase activating enzyme
MRQETDDRKLKGYLFNIQRYSIHDGPGIRTTVFLKGCPLRCYWCQNPESHREKPEVYFDQSLCTACGRCVTVCPSGASTLSSTSSLIDRSQCTACGKCVEVCPNEARRIIGRHTSTEEVFQEIKRDEIFYRKSGGGVTISGGEPLAQPEFTLNLLKLCRESGIHTALDTSGYAKWQTLAQVLNYCDLVLYDIKLIDSKQHMKYTGVSNRLILDNAKRIAGICPMWVRVTVVPGYCNDSVEKIEATAKFIAAELGNSVRVCLLPYHRLGEAKYERLGRLDGPTHIQPPTDDSLLKFKEVFESYGFETQIGG